MITERSCGAVVFTNDTREIKYVIIESKEGFFGFPKGHIEKSESELETARREVLEETGLHVEFLEGFRAEDHYTFRSNGELRAKQVVYFLATYSDQSPIAQESEINSISLMSYEAALSSLQFESAKNILTAAHKHLLALSKIDIESQAFSS